MVLCDGLSMIARSLLGFHRSATDVGLSISLPSIEEDAGHEGLVEHPRVYYRC